MLGHDIVQDVQELMDMELLEDQRGTETDGLFSTGTHKQTLVPGLIHDTVACGIIADVYGTECTLAAGSAQDMRILGLQCVQTLLKSLPGARHLLQKVLSSDHIQHL